MGHHLHPHPVPRRRLSTAVQAAPARTSSSGLPGSLDSDSATCPGLPSGRLSGPGPPSLGPGALPQGRHGWGNGVADNDHREALLDPLVSHLGRLCEAHHPCEFPPEPRGGGRSLITDKGADPRVTQLAAPILVLCPRKVEEDGSRVSTRQPTPPTRCLSHACPQVPCRGEHPREQGSQCRGVSPRITGDSGWVLGSAWG